jgi:hypothetical protein
MSHVVIAAGRQQFRRKKRRPIPVNSASDRIPRGPGCNRHSRVCADASVPAGLPSRFIPTAIGMRFRRHNGIYQSDVGFFQTANPSWTPPPANVQTRARERAGRIALSPIVRDEFRPAIPRSGWSPPVKYQTNTLDKQGRNWGHPLHSKGPEVLATKTEGSMVLYIKPDHQCGSGPRAQYSDDRSVSF